MLTRKACGILLLALAMVYGIAACAGEGGRDFRIVGDSNRYGGLAQQSEAPVAPRSSNAAFRVDIADGEEPMSDTGRFTNIDPDSDKIRIPYIIIDG